MFAGLILETKFGDKPQETKCILRTFKIKTSGTIEIDHDQLSG